MVSLKSLLNFYINSSIHVAFAIVAFTAVTLINFKIPVEGNLLLFIFLATITGYNFVKYAGIAKFQHFSLTKNLRLIQIFSLVAFLGLLVTSFLQPLPVLIIAIVLGLFTGFYALPIFSENRSLRGIPGLKIYIIAFVVAGVTVIMPLVTHEDIWAKDVLVQFLQRFLLAIALILPLEIRDLKYDMAQLGTIPQKYGVRGTRKIGYILILIFLLLEFFKELLRPADTASVIIVGFAAYYYVKNANIRQSPYYSSFWVEAVPVYWLIALLLARFIF